MKHTITVLAALAIGAPAQAAKVKMPDGTVRHSWLMLDRLHAKCVRSDSPKAYYDWATGPDGLTARGYDVVPISPNGVVKNDDGEVVIVLLHVVDRNGQMGTIEFFTDMDECKKFMKREGVEPMEAPESDIN